MLRLGLLLALVGAAWATLPFQWTKPGGNANGSKLSIEGQADFGTGANKSTFTATGQLDLRANSEAYVLRVSSANGTNVFIIRQNGHVIHLGGTPAVSSCGTAPSITGSDTAGVITVGSGVGGSCTITFDSPYLAAPVCICGNETTGLSCRISARSATAITLSGTLGSGDLLDYICKGIE